MKILIVANNLSQGGIQTSLLNLLKEISKDSKYEIELFLFSEERNRIKEIPNNVKIIKGNYFLKLTGTSLIEIIKTKNIINIIVRFMLMVLVRLIKPKKYFNLLFKLNKNYIKYDYAVSYFNDIPNTYFNRGATYYVLNFANARRKVAWVHTDIKQAKFNIDYYKKEYNGFDTIINVSNHCKDVYDELIPEQKDKTSVIYNFFPIDEIKNKSMKKQNIINKKEEYMNFITVARIDNISKRINRIVEIVKKLKEKNIKNFKWYIIGDGPDYKNIEKAIKEENLEENIILLGNKSNPYPYIKASDLFILTSDFEGFPMVIGESLILGTPILTTNYDSAKEQITDGINGIIVEKDTEKIAQELENILANKEILKKFKKNIKKEKITNTVAKKQFDKIFGEVNGKK